MFNYWTYVATVLWGKLHLTNKHFVLEYLKKGEVMQKENKTLDKSSKVAIAVFIVFFCVLSGAMAIDANKKRDEMIKRAEIAKQKADSISKNVETLKLFQRTK